MSDKCEFCNAEIEDHYPVEEDCYVISKWKCGTHSNKSPYDTGITRSKDCRIAELERQLAKANKRICPSCLEVHPIGTMCPPHEVRTTGEEWFRIKLKELEDELEKRRAAMASCSGSCNRFCL